jgi:hypothetical protein
MKGYTCYQLFEVRGYYAHAYVWAKKGSIKAAKKKAAGLGIILNVYPLNNFRTSPTEK